MNSRGWPADEIAALCRRVAVGWTDGRIGEELDRAREPVRRQRADLRLTPGQSAVKTAAVRRLKARRKARSLP